MASSLIHGKHVLCRIDDRSEPDIIEDGAVFQRNGRIVDVGRYLDLQRKHQPDEVIGNGTQVVMPGFINAHHHIGITPFQRGVKNDPLEVWAVSMMGACGADQYLDTLYSAFEMIESGVTTVQHLHGWGPGPIEKIAGLAEQTIRAYEDIGMRASYSYCVRDQNYLVYEAEDSVLRELPEDVATQVAAEVAAHASVTLREYFALFEDLYSRYHDHDRIRIQLAPANLHWCSDAALQELQQYSARYGVPLHMHLLESVYQKEYARRRSGVTAIEHLRDLDMLGPHLTLGHGIWVTEKDIEILTETGTRICHNCSSNLCLRSGIMPLNHYRKHGTCVALGIDGATINDDRDMLQEMRLVLNLHRVPGMKPDDVPGSAEVFRMATENGAYTTPFQDQIGTLEVGKRADVILLDWEGLTFPFLHDDVSVIDAIVHRAKAREIRTVIIDGQVIMMNGEYTRVNKQEALSSLAESWRKPENERDSARRAAFRRATDDVRKFYGSYAPVTARDWTLH